MPYLPPAEHTGTILFPPLDPPTLRTAEPTIMFYYKGPVTYASVVLFTAASLMLVLAGAVSRHVRRITLLFCSAIKYGASFAFSRSHFESITNNDEPVEIVASIIERKRFLCLKYSLELMCISDNIEALESTDTVSSVSTSTSTEGWFNLSPSRALHVTDALA